jgi:hypothetical protein
MLGKISEEAVKLITGDRHDQHGDFRENFQTIANLWTSYLGVVIRPNQVALMMALLKIARSRANPAKRDNFVDMVGYVELGSALASMVFPPKRPEEPANGEPKPSAVMAARAGNDRPPQ